MNFSFIIAVRYFFTKRKRKFIQVISLLSMVAIAFSTAALIIVLSVFNGLEDLMHSIYGTFDPSIKIEATKGKSFPYTDSLQRAIYAVPGVKIVTPVIEDYVYLRYRDADMVATMKGVAENFLLQHRLDGHVEGALKLQTDSLDFAIIGQGVQYTLSLGLEDPFFPLQVFYIKDVSAGSLQNPYLQRNIKPVGVFAIEQNYDENYILVPLRFAENLLQYGNKRTSLEVLTEEATVGSVATSLKQALGDSFRVLTNDEQHQDLYRLLKMEKLFTFVALVLLILIASINIFLSLMMLVIEKKKDITVLSSLGASQTMIKRIFLMEGALISWTGAFVGLLVGAVLCWLQQNVGLIGMGLDNGIVSDYPIKMLFTDFILTFFVIVAISFLVSFYPTRLAAQTFSLKSL